VILVDTHITTGISQLLKISLFPFTPLQARIDPPSPVHGWFLEHALQTLKEDGLVDAALFFSSFQAELNHGLLWADKGWKNFSHYCQAEHKYWPRASLEADGYYTKGLNTFDKNVRKTFFYLGAALHIIQDMNVPHHAAGVLKDGHQEFESWVLSNWNDLCSSHRGCYRAYQKPSEWIRYSVSLAKPYLPLVSLSQGATESSFMEAALFLVPLNISVSAGFLVMAHTALCCSALST
jgi:phospholipase C